MRDDDPPNGAAAEHILENFPPSCLGVVERHARVDNGPALFPIIDQPEIDPFQGEWQRHPDPIDARRHFDRTADLWGLIAKGIFELCTPGGFTLKAIHSASVPCAREMTNASPCGMTIGQTLARLYARDFSALNADACHQAFLVENEGIGIVL